MVITLHVNRKMLVAVLVIALMTGAFFAGRRYQAHSAKVAISEPGTGADSSQDHPDVSPKPSSNQADPYAAIAKPIKPGDTLVISDKEVADHEVAWCKAHPNTKWIVLVSAETLKHIQEWLPGADGADIRLTGLCDANGRPWKDVRTFGKE